MRTDNVSELRSIDEFLKLSTDRYTAEDRLRFRAVYARNRDVDPIGFPAADTLINFLGQFDAWLPHQLSVQEFHRRRRVTEVVLHSDLRDRICTTDAIRSAAIVDRLVLGETAERIAL